MNKEKYQKFCETEEELPIFLQNWWLDAVCGENQWDVLISEKGDEIVGVWPYYKTKKFFYQFLIKPKLTPYLGIWLKYPIPQKITPRLSYEKDIINQLFKQLPKFSFFYQDFHYQFTNWLPLYWQKFKQTTIYTYLLEDLTNLDYIYSNFKENIKREIKKAEKMLTITTNIDLADFYHLNQMTFKRQNITIPYSYEFIQRLDTACQQRECRKIFAALDENNQIHSALYIVWDKKSGYYLMSGSNPQYRTSGAASLLSWEAIKYCSTVTKAFDFEGSIIEPIEKFFRSFGGKQIPYHRITKSQSLLLSLTKSLLDETTLGKKFKFKAK